MFALHGLAAGMAAEINNSVGLFRTNAHPHGARLPNFRQHIEQPRLMGTIYMSPSYLKAATRRPLTGTSNGKSRESSPRSNFSR